MLPVQMTKRAKPRAKNINIFSTTQHPSAHIKTSGRRLKAKAVVSAMPVARARTRITAVVIAVPFLGCVEIDRTGQGHP